MRLSSRSKLSILLSAVTFVTIIGAIVLTAVPRGTATHAAGHSSRFSSGTTTQATVGGSGPTAIRGTATPDKKTSLHGYRSPVEPSGQLLQSHAYYPHVRVNRLGRNGTIPTETLSSVPSVRAVSGSPDPTLVTGQLLQNFNGVSSRDSAVANIVDGRTFDTEPPDQGLCVGPLAFFGQEVVVEPVNSALTFYSTSGTSLLGPLPLSSFLIEPSSLILSDPRCVFDPATGDFFFSVTVIPNNESSHIDVTVLRQDGSFTRYSIDTTDDGTNGTPKDPGCPCFGDGPLLGIDQFNVYVSTNEFSILGPNFNGANVYAISKSQIAAFAPFANVVFFVEVHNADNIPVEGLQPAISVGNPPAEFLVHSFVVDVNGNNTTGDHRLGVFAITNRQAVTSGIGVPALTGFVIQSETYSQPQPARSTGGVVLNPGDDRLQQVQYINGFLWTALDTGFGVPVCQVVCDAAAWFQISTAVTNNQFLGAVVSKQGYVAVLNTNLLYPAIVQSSHGTVEMAFSITTSTLNPSAAFETQVGSGPLGTGEFFVAETGTGPDKGFTCTGSAAPGCRWGDYSAAALDPISGNVWLASEYIPPESSQSIFSNWGTRVYEAPA